MDKTNKNQKATLSPEERQRNLDNISQEDLEKLESFQAKTNSASPVDEEWLLLTEFALKFGWQAYLDVKDDKISGAEMHTLLAASRKLSSADIYYNAISSFMATLSVQTKNPYKAFRSLTKNLHEQMKADTPQ